LEKAVFSGGLPTYKLVSKDEHKFIADLQTHTNVSYSSQWSPLAMIRQHLRSGFQGAFVTDYNTVKGAEESLAVTRNKKIDFLIFPGEEYKGEKVHLLLLGINKDITPDRYSVSEAIAQTHKLNGVVIVAHYFKMGYQGYSIPELVKMGVDGFEIANRYPANGILQKQLIKNIYQACNVNGLVMTGGTDNHGLRSATYVWNAFALQDDKINGPLNIKKQIMDILIRHQQKRIEVITIYSKEYHGWLRKVFDAPFSMFYYFRALNLWQWFSWVLWTGLFYTIVKSGKGWS
jgi:predicted metal-dependent phosphoesterase TrpH